MRNEDGGDADAVDDVAQALPQRLPHLRVQRPKRLVQQQQPARQRGSVAVKRNTAFITVETVARQCRWQQRQPVGTMWDVFTAPMRWASWNLLGCAPSGAAIVMVARGVAVTQRAEQPAAPSAHIATLSLSPCLLQPALAHGTATKFGD